MSGQDPDLPGSLVLVGAGKMGGAMLTGWLAAGLPPERVAVADPQPSADLAATAGARGIRVGTVADAPPRPDILVLAIKPQGLADAAPAIRPLVGPGTTILSVLAGKTVADLAGALPGTDSIARAMPNLPASIGRGATGVYATDATTPRQRRTVERLLSGIGLVEWVGAEALIDAVTAVSGSGPAYLFHFVECLTEAGIAAGLEPALAARLARRTVTGAAELLDRTGGDPGELRANVTSPGGTTAAAFAVLAGPDGLAALMGRAVDAARRRAAELSG